MARECFPIDGNSSDPPKHGTLHYNLPQWMKDWPTSWLTQMNYAMQRIDDVMWQLALRTGIDGLPDETVEEVVRLSNWSQMVDEKLASMLETLGNELIAQGNMQKQLTSIQTRLETLTTNLVNIDTRMSTLESKMEGLQIGLEKIENNLNALTERVEVLESKEPEEPENTE